MKKIFLFLLIAALLLPGLALARTTVDPVSNRGINPQRGLPNNPAIPGESMVTGLKTDAPYLPILVNIDNVQGAWPQWGIAEADLIYEMPIHGLSLTRLMALFAYSHPASAGPVRSGRVMHAEMRQEWDSGWAFVGWQDREGSSVPAALRKFGARDSEVDLILNGGGGKFGKYFSLKKGYGGPHNHSANLASLANEIQGHPFTQRPFLFSDELPQTGEPASVIHVEYGNKGSSYASSRFDYNPETNLYSRFRNNTPYVDANNRDVTLAFSNVIVQWTELKFNGAADAPLLKEVGEGNADIFTGGRYIRGYWVREGINSRTVFYDQDGQEIRLQRGKTFINITTDRSTKLIYE